MCSLYHSKNCHHKQINTYNIRSPIVICSSARLFSIEHRMRTMNNELYNIFLLSQWTNLKLKKDIKPNDIVIITVWYSTSFDLELIGKWLGGSFWLALAWLFKFTWYSFPAKLYHRIAVVVQISTSLGQVGGPHQLFNMSFWWCICRLQAKC